MEKLVDFVRDNPIKTVVGILAVASVSLFLRGVAKYDDELKQNTEPSYRWTDANRWDKN